MKLTKMRWLVLVAGCAANLSTWWTLDSGLRFIAFGLFIVGLVYLGFALTHRPKPAIEQSDFNFVLNSLGQPDFLCQHHRSFFCEHEPLLEVGQRSFDCQCVEKKAPKLNSETATSITVGSSVQISDCVFIEGADHEPALRILKLQELTWNKTPGQVRTQIRWSHATGTWEEVS